MQFAEPSRLDRDVTVRWRAATDAVGLRLVEGAGLKGDDGRYGLLTIVPPGRPETTFARDLTLLIDASGSMSGPSIEAARELSGQDGGQPGAAGSLPDSRLRRSEVERIVGEPTAATPANIARAQKALAGLQAGGATEMSHALEEALRPLRGDSLRQVVLMTDGYIGFEQEVVERILNHLPSGARLHVVGIGSAPNRTLTRGASRAGRGVEVLVAGTAAVEEAAARLLAATVAPVLTDITIEGPAVVAVAPERPRDVLAGQPLVVALELSPKGGEVRVRGSVQGMSEGWTRVMEVPAPGAATAHQSADRGLLRTRGDRGPGDEARGRRGREPGSPRSDRGARPAPPHLQPVHDPRRGRGGAVGRPAPAETAAAPAGRDARGAESRGGGVCGRWACRWGMRRWALAVGSAHDSAVFTAEPCADLERAFEKPLAPLR